MKLIEYPLYCDSRATTFTFYVIGDAHVGATNCAEDKIKALVKIIKANPNARWLGGGDLTDNVIISDVKRFDPTVLPPWMLHKRTAGEVVEGLQDIVGAQKKRLYQLLDPIKDQCLGLVEGNHEYAIMKHHNRDVMTEMCEHFNVPNLTDCAFIRFKFIRKTGKGAPPTAVVKAFITHGHGGGRTSGAEPNILYRLAADKDCEIVWKGHSHTFALHSPIPMLSMPNRGEVPENATVYYKYAANWGSYLYTYQAGPSTYASRANYPVRPMYTVETRVHPFQQQADGVEQPRIEMLPLHL